MQIELLHGSAAATASVHVLLLPGVQQRSQDFEREGLIEALRRRVPGAHLSLITPALAHLNDRAWLPQLHAHIAALSSAPVWIGGISLGAFMALRYGAEYPQGLHGLCLLAPYLGSRLVAAEIERGGGLRHWRAGVLDADDDERRVWQYARTLAQPTPRVFLGLGSEDRFADSQYLLANALPSACTCTCPGGHDWPVWRRLWENFLDRNLDSRTPATGACG